MGNVGVSRGYTDHHQGRGHPLLYRATGNTFLKKKKITPTHSQAICDAVGQYNWNIVEFNESHQSFFKIMTYYYPAIGMIPEDVRYLELRRQLFDFFMKNTEYTKVNSKALIQ